MKKYSSFLGLLFIISSVWPSISTGTCLSESYLHKMPYDVGAAAIEKLEHFNPLSLQTTNLISTVSHKNVGGKEVVFLNEYFAANGALRNSIRVEADGNRNYYGVDLLGKGVTSMFGGLTEYYILANTSHGSNPNDFGRVALFRVRITSAGIPILMWEVQLGHSTLGDFNNLIDNKAVSLKWAAGGGVLVVGNKIENKTGCVKPFVTRVDPMGNVVFQKFYGECSLVANGSTIAEVYNDFSLPGFRLAITGEKKSLTGDSDVFIMLVNEQTGDLAWIKSYTFTQLPNVEIGRSITSYTEFVPGPNQVRDRLVVTGETKVPNTHHHEQKVFVLQVATLTGVLHQFKEYSVFDGSTEIFPQGLVVRKDFNDDLVVGGRLFDIVDPNSAGVPSPFLMKVFIDGSVDWFKTYMSRDIITPNIDMIPSKGDDLSCDYYNMVVIGQGTSPMLDFHSLQLRADVDGEIEDADCPPQPMTVTSFDGGGEQELPIVILDYPYWSGFPTSVHTEFINILDCGDFPTPGGPPFGFRMDNTTDELEHLTDHSWNLSINPNPVADAMEISVDLKEAAPVSVDFYNVQGQLVDQLSQQEMAEGNNKIPFNVGHLANGVYFCKVLTAEKSETIRFVKSN